MLSRTLHIGEDNTIEWDEMKRETDGAFVNNATVTWVLKDASGNAVSGASGTLSYVSNSDGKYQGALESSVTLVEKALYTLEITAVSGGFNGFRKIRCIALYHEAEE